MLAMLAVPTCAQDVLYEDPGVSILDWTVRVQPRAWFAGISGDVRLPGGSEEVSFDQLDLDEPALRPMLELDYRKDRWRITLNAFYVDEQSEVSSSSADTLGGIAFVPGDRLNSSVQYLSVEALGGYEMWRYAGGTRDDGRSNVESIVELVGGVRFSAFNVEFEANRGSTRLGRSEASHLFGMPMAGVRWRLGLYQMFEMETNLNVGAFDTGGDHSSSSINASTQLAYRPTPNLGALFGYRVILNDFQDGSGDSGFEYFGDTAGLYVGVELRF